MLKLRIIPKFLIKKGKLFKAVCFDKNLREAGNVISAAKVYNSYGVDELILLDTDAFLENRSTNLNLIEAVSKEVFMPLTVGGGIRTIDDIKALLRAGADKVSINRSLIQNPKFVEKAAKIFGSQCIVASIDYRTSENGRLVYVNGGKDATGNTIESMVKNACDLGCGEILLSSIDRDGTYKGYDLEAIEKISKSISVPLIASSGAGSLQHVAECFDSGASAVTVSSMFFFSDHSPIKLRTYLRSRGYNIRANNSSRN